MNTREELYVESEGKLLKVDLNYPSGITLKYNSNLFSDLSKITCSYSYTFNLPMTMNNRRIFDFAEDIRHHSSMIRKRVKAVFYQNGVELFRNANLYLESVTDSYKAVMTWDVIDGMQELIDRDMSLNEIPGYDIELEFGRVDDGTQAELFDNDSDALFPMYNAGIPYYLWEGYILGSEDHRQSIQRFTTYGTFPVPVVPVYHLVQMINKHYGTKFNLGNHLGIGDFDKYNPQREVYEKSVLPLCGIDLTYEQRYIRRAVLTGIKFTNIDKTITLDDGEWHIPDVITFNSISIRKDDFLYPGSFRASKPSEAGDSFNNAGINCRLDNISIEIDGCLEAGFKEKNLEDTPTLSVLQMQKYFPEGYNGAGARGTVRSFYKWVELASIDGENVGTFSNGAPIWRFDFASVHGATRLSFDNVCYYDQEGSSAYNHFGNAYSPIIFVFNYTLGALQQVDKDIEFFIINSDKVTMPHKIDLVSNLPAISCLTFMKSLFYMLGAYPYVDRNGNIIAKFFSEIKENLNKGNVIDWSSKIVRSANGSGDEEIKFAQSSSYAQRNYYLMKSDDVDAKIDPEDRPEDIYDTGIGCVNVENSTLSISQTVIQLPFYPPYIKNTKFPSFDTGNTIKAWDLEKNDGNIYRANYLKEYCKPQPALGIIKDRDHGYVNNNGEFVYEGTRMTMEIWNGFKNISSNPSLNYLQEIIRKPFIVTDILLLNENDLMNLDYTIPVYLNKYNSYFAIITINRNSDGICKCELIKLP